jgi:hypothetical protein
MHVMQMNELLRQMPLKLRQKESAGTEKHPDGQNLLYAVVG